MHSPRYGLFRSNCWWVLLLLVCYAPANKWRIAGADEPATISTNVSDEVDLLVNQLGDAAFATREAASKRLQEIGAPAVDTLQKAKKHPNIEVRERASRICDEIERHIFESVTKQFILAADGQQSFGLPAWDVFRSIAGDSRTSKLLFVTMLRSQSDLARSVEAVSQSKGTANSAIAIEELAARATAEANNLRLRSVRGELPSVGDTVGLLLACSQFSDNAAVDSASNEVNEVVVASLYRAPQTEYFLKAGYDRCMRALAGRWISKTQDSLANDVLSIAMQRNIPEGAVVARRHLDPSSERETRVSALQCLARFGNESDIPTISALLQEETIVYEFTDQSDFGYARDGIHEDNVPPPGLQRLAPPQNVRKMIVRLNDLALAVCMLLDLKTLMKRFRSMSPTRLMA